MTMTIDNFVEDDVIKRSEIGFPRGLNLEEEEQLLEYLAWYLPADIIYNASYSKGFIHEIEELNENVINKIGPENYKIHGRINSRKKAMAFDSFECIFDVTNRSFMGIKFAPIPGYSLNDHRKEVIELWNSVRDLVRTYFDSHKKH